MRATGLAAAASAALLMATFISGGASAQQPSSAQATAIRSACRADYQSHCASVPTGGSAALQCLMQNSPSLSPGCQQALAAVQGGTGAAPAPAPPPLRAPVTTQPAAPPPLRPPVTAQPAPPSPAMMRQACGLDYRRYCHGIPPGGGRALACLQANRDRLSRSCSGALAAMQSHLPR